MRKIGVGDFIVTPAMREAVGEVLDSGRISYGDKSRELERRFAAMHGCEYGVLSNSGTSSLQVGLQALKEYYNWDDGDEVITSSITFVATVNIILHNRMRPVIVDPEPDYYGIDPDKIEAAITPRTRAIIPVHLFGQPCDMKRIMEVAYKHSLAALSDSCETVLATHHGIPLGEWGDMTAFSFYVAHLLITGVGGITITNHEPYNDILRSLVNHGRCSRAYFSIDDDDELVGEKLEEVVAKRFRFDRVGHSFRITELEAAIGVAGLDTIKDDIATRQRNAWYLIGLLNPLEDRIQLPLVRPETTHSFMMLPLVMREESKWPLVNYLEEHGIETREMMRLTGQPCYKGLWNPADYPVAAWINHGGLYVGCHPGLDLDDMAYIAEEIHKWAKEN